MTNNGRACTIIRISGVVVFVTGILFLQFHSTRQQRTNALSNVNIHRLGRVPGRLAVKQPPKIFKDITTAQSILQASDVITRNTTRELRKSPITVEKQTVRYSYGKKFIDDTGPLTAVFKNEEYFQAKVDEFQKLYSASPGYKYYTFKQAREQINLDNLQDAQNGHLTASNLLFVAQPPCTPKYPSHNFTVYVKSQYERGYNRRNHIRQSWGNRFNVIFIVMSTRYNTTTRVRNPLPPSYIAEIETNRDMLVIGNFRDYWHMLSYKVIAALRHSLHCQQELDTSPSIVITDDDVHWWLGQVERDFTEPLNWLESPAQALQNTYDGYVLGRVVWSLRPVRVPKGNGGGRYSISERDWPFQIYPPFPAGQGYVISGNAVRLLYGMLETVPSSLNQLDDIFLGILIHFNNAESSNKGKIKLIHDRRFGNEDRRYWIGQAWPCSQINMHQHVVDDRFEAVRRQSCSTNSTFKAPGDYVRNFNL